MWSSKFVPKVMTEMCIIILTLLLYLLVPVLTLVLFVPIYTFRFAVFKTSWLLRPDLSKMLTCISSSFVVGLSHVYTKPKNTILVYGVVEGHAEMGTFRESFQSLLEQKDPKGNLIYPEMKQYITAWCGFFFWKPVKSFEIERHIRLYDEEKLCESKGELNMKDFDSQTIVRLAQIVIKEPFPKEQSPWEFLMLHNRSHCPSDSGDDNKKDDGAIGGGGKKTLLIIRLHHSLADGYSLFNLVMKHAQVVTVQQAKPAFGKGPSFRKILSSALFPFRMPYEMLWQFFHCFDSNKWHLPEKSMARDNCGVVTRTIPTDFVKNIKNQHKASFAGVILTALAGGIRKTMIQNRVAVPKHIHCLTPLPVPNHPEKLRNLMTGCFVKLPLDMSNPLERLKAVGSNLGAIRESTVLQTNFFMNKVVGGTFSFVSERLWKPVLCTATLSSFPGPEQEVSYLGHRMMNCGFLGNVDVGNIGINVTLFSYNGNLDMCLTVDKSILGSAQQMKDFMENVMGELQVLAAEDIV